jgi:hypothetical protein
VIVQGHCHQRAVIGLDDEERVLKRLGLRYSFPETACCGMAGGFGFHKGYQFDVSMKCGERALLPAVRAAAPRRSSSPTVSVARNRSLRPPAGVHCTSRKSFKWLSAVQKGTRAW